MSDTLPPDLEQTPPHGVPLTVPASADRVRVTRDRGRHVRTHGTPYEARRRKRPLTRRGRIVVIFLAVVLVLAGLAGWYEAEANPFGATGKAVVVDVKAGSSMSAIASQLTHSGVIGSSFAFRVWTLLHGAPTVRPGHYQLHRNESFSTLKTQLSAGPNIYDLVVHPGNTLAEIAGSLSSLPGAIAQPFVQEARAGAVHSPYQPSPGASLEGLIGTGTYQVVPGETAHELLAQMVDRFDAEAAKAGLTPATTVTGLTPYELVTAASIAQKEGYFTRYLGQVVRVVYNRLAAGIHLDMTSTVLYSLGQDGGTVTPAEEQDPTPYNTYLNTGLTPTPICTPSEAALAAAVAPPAGTWLYFDLVTAKKGTMVFSSTYTAQVAAENEAAANATAQRGTGTP